MAAPTNSTSRARIWIAWALSILPALMLLVSGAAKLAQPQGLEEGMTQLGWPLRLAVPLGILEITCTLVYLFPRTSILGAILLTGYMGGAVATHVRIGEPFVMQVLVGLCLWGGLYLREPRLRPLLPLRS